MGIFICEIKARKWGKFASDKQQIEKVKLRCRYEFVAALREFVNVRVPIHTLLMCESQEAAGFEIHEEEESEGGEWRFVCDISLQIDFPHFWGQLEHKIVGDKVDDHRSFRPRLKTERDL